jgi:thioester reductase-like protein
LGIRVLAKLLTDRPELKAYVLVRDAARWTQVTRSREMATNRISVLLGDVRQPGLGLTAADRRNLSTNVETVLHLAADTLFSRPLSESRATNLEGTRNVLQATSPAARFCHVSTAFVAGRRTGVILESDRGGQAGWVNAYEQSKWEAEQIVRESGREFLILRSSTVVSDSADGFVTQYNAVHRALRLFYHGLAPMLPGRASAPVDLVTGDYIADAIAGLALRSELGGETLHLCAGAGSASLGELIDVCHDVWSQDLGWRRRSIAKPAFTALGTYRLFEEGVAETADPRLQQASRALSYFVPQLALEKRFDTSRADKALGTPAPRVLDYWSRVVRHLADHPWMAALMGAAA